MRIDRTKALALAAAALLVLGACGGDAEEAPESAETETTTEEDAGGEDATALTVSAVDNSFEPASLSAPAGSEVTIEVTNDGANPHTFTIDDLGVDSGSLASGESATVTFDMGEDTVTFYCAIHGEAMMSGEIEAS